MAMKNTLIISALVGAACGILSTYPFALGPGLSMSFWTIAGLGIGLFVKGLRTVIWSGIAFGVCLSVVFLFSRFGGTPDKIPSYSVFMAALSVIGAFGGVVTVSVGSRLRKLSNREKDEGFRPGN